MNFVKKYACYLALIVAVFAGIIEGNLSAKASIAAERTAADRTFVHAGQNLRTVRIEPIAGQTLSDVVFDFSAFAGYRGVYAGTSAADGFAEIGKKRFDTVICFEGQNGVFVTEESVVEGRALCSSDAADGKKANVVVGGKNWENFAVGDTVELTLFAGPYALAVEATVVGKTATPLASDLFSGEVDAYKTYGGIIVLPGDLTSELIPNAFDQYVVAVSGDAEYSAVLSSLSSSEKYRVVQQNDYVVDRKIPKYGDKFYLFFGVTLGVVCSVLLAFSEGKTKSICSVVYCALGAATIFLSAAVFKNSVSSKWFAEKTFSYAAVFAAVTTVMSLVFLSAGIVETKKLNTKKRALVSDGASKR